MKKELSPKQLKIAEAAEPRDKITGADFQALKSSMAEALRKIGILLSLTRIVGLIPSTSSRDGNIKDGSVRRLFAINMNRGNRMARSSRTAPK